MAEIDKAAEARRKAQRNGEEDPVVIAQRFLNIYRQIHIFTPERKAAFNKMLLELPADIRGLFGSLPGGALLQDYVDELAEKEGVEKSKAPTAANVDDEEVSKAKILATALAEAQAQATAKIQAAPAAAAPAAGVIAAAPSKLSLDKDFAATFAATLADAMQKNNAAQKDDIRNIIQTLGQTQLQIVKVLQNESAQQRQEMQSIYKAISESEKKIAAASGQPQAALAAASDETQNLIKVLVSGQQQLAQRLGKVEAAAEAISTKAAAPAQAPQPAPAALSEDGFKQISQAILNSQENFGKTIAVLSERQKNDTLEIARLINESQQQMMNFMVQHNTLNQNSGNAAASSNNANNIQINTTDYSQQLNQIVEKLANLQISVSLPESAFATAPAAPAAVPAAAPVSAATPIAANFDFDGEKIGKMLQDAVATQSELYREMAKSQTEELGSMITLALKESQKLSTQSLIEALKANPVIVQTPANTAAENSSGAYNRPFAHGHGPVGEPEIDDIIDISEITPPRHVRMSDNLPHLQPAPETFETKGISPDKDEAPAEEPAAQAAPLFELADDQPEEAAEQPDIPAAETFSAADVTEEPAPKKKKKKKSAEAELSEVLAAPAAEIELADTDIALPDEDFPLTTESETAPDMIEEVPVEETAPEARDETDGERDILSAMTASAPPMDELPSDEELGLDDTDDDFINTTADENIGANWLGSVEEESSAEASDFAPVLADNEFSADDWGFGSGEAETKTAPAAAAAFDDAEEAVDTESGASDGEGEEWVWEYIEDEPEAANINYGNDNLEPILQQSAVCCGDLFYQNPSFDGATISANTLPQGAAYNLSITDSAAGAEDDPYQKGVIKD
ncbi:MAG: hypothetical protein IJ482_00770 [Alphaproteobacteria bacterium]|nr:hypothetical protein [Alphaproteobacteria bacterium]